MRTSAVLTMVISKLMRNSPRPILQGESMSDYFDSRHIGSLTQQSRNKASIQKDIVYLLDER
jgi:hypothetical protein